MNKLRLINEAYTSKASYIDKDELIFQDSFSGKRIKRGLYQSKDKILINAKHRIKHY